MNIQRIELLTVDLEVQKDFYTNILELPAEPTPSQLLIKAGATEILFTQASSGFDGAYHFAFNIAENQYFAAKQWASGRFTLLREDRKSTRLNSSHGSISYA